MNLRLFLMLLAVVLAAAALAAVLVPRVIHADGAGIAGPGSAGAAGLVIDGRGPLWMNELGPVDALYAECTALPCVIQIDTGSRRAYLIVGPPAPRG